MVATGDFDEKKFGRDFLSDILSWVSENFEPDDIYDESTLREYVRGHFTLEELFNYQELKDTVGRIA